MSILGFSGCNALNETFTMKKLLFLSLFASLISCSDDFIYATLTVEIDSESTEFYNFINSQLTLGMWVREEGKKEWDLWPQTDINGYIFEEGYYTRAEITRIIDKKKLGYDGGSADSYNLIRILEKRKSESVRTK